jgi:hypothetical protein
MGVSHYDRGLMTHPAPHPWKAALALRWTVLRRRYVSPLELVILGVVTVLAYLVGKEAAENQLLLGYLPAALSALFLAWTLAGARLARRLLYTARELPLLVPSGVHPRLLVRLRLVELLALNAVALVPMTAVLVGIAVARGRAPSPLLLAAPPPTALGLAATSLILGWASAQLGRAGPALLLLLGGGAAAVAALVPGALAPALAFPGSPGWAWTQAGDGQPLALASLLAWALPAAGLAVALGQRGFGEAVDRAARRATGRPGPLWPLLGLVTRPLGQRGGALVRRDLTLLARGSFVRGVVILALLPASLGIVGIVAHDGNSKDWHAELVGLLVVGVAASAAGFLFGVDFPRARRGQLLLERVQPLRGRTVLLSRWLPAATYGLLLACGAALVIAGAPKGPIARQALPTLLGAALVAAAVSHHAVSYGLRSETSLDPAEAAAYPMNGGVVLIVLAVLVAIHPALILAYPVIWLGFVRSAIRRWETAEVETSHEAAA